MKMPVDVPNYIFLVNKHQVLVFDLVFLDYGDLQMSKMAEIPNYTSPAGIDSELVQNFQLLTRVLFQNYKRLDDLWYIFQVNKLQVLLGNNSIFI